MYQFGNFQLDPTEHLLLRAGQPVPLTPKTFDLLLFLIEHRGRLVTKDQILEAVWPESFVEEANLTVSISTLRKALGEKRGNNQYIDTVPKRGYRFTAGVTEVSRPPLPSLAAGAASEPQDATVDGMPAAEDSQAVTGAGTRFPTDEDVSDQDLARIPIEPAASTSRVDAAGNSAVRKPHLILAMSLCLLALAVGAIGFFRWKTPSIGSTAPRRLAVLPFQNLRHDAAIDFLGFSLADAIINKLGYVNQLAIRPSYAVQKYRTELPDVQQAAKSLSVDTLLTGSFIREGEDLRVSYQLVDTAGNRILRQGTVDVKYQNLLAVQDDVSAQVIHGLALTLSPSESAELKSQEKIPPLAYEYYLRGVDLYSRGDFPMASKILEKSAELYPAYALTWAHLGRTYTASASFQFGGAELYDKARAAYEKALALQPNFLPARIYMANLLTDTGNPEQAVPLLRETLATNPNLAEAHWELGYAYRHAGMLAESIRECNRARELDPSVKLTSSVMNAYLYLGDYNEFLRSLPPVNNSAFVEFYRGFALYHLHQWDLAAEALDHAYQLDPTMLQAQVGEALSHRIRHENDEGLALLSAAENKITQRGVGDPEALYKVAQAYAELGDSASALRAFRNSVQTGFFPYPYFVRDPLMAAIRSKAQFQSDLQSARQRSAAFKTKFF